MINNRTRYDVGIPGVGSPNSFVYLEDTPDVTFFRRFDAGLGAMLCSPLSQLVGLAAEEGIVCPVPWTWSRGGPFTALYGCLSPVAKMLHDNLRSSDTCFGHAYRAFDTTITWPAQPALVPGDGKVLDSGEYRPPFCRTCCAPHIRALEATPKGWRAHSCFVAIPDRCQGCDPRFAPGGAEERDLGLSELFLPSDMIRNLHAQQNFKFAHSKKNLHLAFVARCEGEMDAKREAAMFYMPAIVQLQSTEARRLPRWANSRFFRWLVPSAPIWDEQAMFATPWLPCDHEDWMEASDDVEAASHLCARQDAQIAEHGGKISARLHAFDRPAAEAAGITGLPPDEMMSVPDHQTVDGRDAVVGPNSRIGPLPSLVVNFDPKAPQNTIGVVTGRIGDPHACKRKHKYAPSDSMKTELKVIADLIERRVFTREKILKAATELELLEKVMAGKVNKEKVNEWTADILAAHGCDTKIPIIVKNEVTTNPEKPPRGIMDMGPESHLANAMVIAVYEKMWGEFDCGLNIKKDKKSTIIDNLTQACSAQGIFATLPQEGSRVDPDTAVIVECDFGKFEYAQTAEFIDDKEGKERGYKIAGYDNPVELGLLFIEKKIILKIAQELPNVLNELANTRQQVEYQKREKCKSTFCPKPGPVTVKMGRVNWRFVLFMLCRLSGDLQTSVANRGNGLIAHAICTLKQGRDLFLRLLDVYEGNIPRTDMQYPSFWRFRLFTGEMGFWKPWMEGDDHAAILIGINSLSLVNETRANQSAECLQVTARLASLGLEGALFFHKSARAEFVGVHMMVQNGYTVPCCWTPDIARALPKAGVSTSPATAGNDQVSAALNALTFASRAASFQDRVEPMFQYFKSQSDWWWSKASAFERDAFTVVNWEQAAETGMEYKQKVAIKDLIAIFHSMTPTRPLRPEQQKRIAEASLGEEIPLGEWTTWHMASVNCDDCSDDALLLFPKCLRRKSSRVQFAVGALCDKVAGACPARLPGQA